MKSRIFILTMCLCMFFNNIIFASNIISENETDIVFVVDCSNSMNANDNEKIVSEVMKIYVDLSYSNKTNIGIVTYNDSIVSTYPLTSIININDRNSIKKYIDNIKRYGSTDIGLALNKGIDMLSQSDSQKKILILLSDGETDLTYSKTRIMEDSIADESNALQKAKALNCPIFTIGFNNGGSINIEHLKKISNETGGKNYVVNSSAELFDTFNALYTDTTGTTIINNGITTSTGEFQSLLLDIPYNYVTETNILIQSKNRLNEVKLENITSDTQYYNSKMFSSFKLIEPQLIQTTLSFLGKKDDTIKVYTVNFFDISPVIITAQNDNKNVLKITARLKQVANDSIIEDSNLYKGLVAKVLISGNDINDSLEMTNKGNVFEADYKLKKEGDYTITVYVEGNGYKGSVSNTYNIGKINTEPERINEDKINLYKTQIIDLNNYFKDIDNDTLNYIQVSENTKYNVSVENNNITVKPLKLGSELLTLKVSDGNGGEITQDIDVNVAPYWISINNPIVLAVICFIIILIVYLLLFKNKRKAPEPVEVVETPVRNNKKFAGGFEGYFLKTLSENEIPALHWLPSYLDNKNRITLYELLNMLDVKEKLSETYRIYFEAGNNNTVIFYHKTNCIVTFGKKNVPDGAKQVLEFGDRLYIVFEDNITEMEFRYKKPKKLNKNLEVNEILK